MRTPLQRWLLCTGLCVMCALLPASAQQPMDDAQLADVFAAGFNIQVDLDLGLVAEDPNAIVTDGKPADALHALNSQLVNRSVAPQGFRSEGSFDEGGVYTPGVQNMSTNTLTIADNAMQNASTLLNIIALNGDVAVGMNLNIVINPVDSPVNITQTNINWANIGVLDVQPTPSTPTTP